MISTSNVTMRYGNKLLFEDVSVTFTTGRRYGLTGPNGAGKSTFMKVMTGEIDPQKGTVVRPRKVGVLKQDQYEFDAYRVIDTVIMGNKALWAALASTFPTSFTTAKCPSCKAVRKSACCCARRSSGSPRRCCWTSPPTTLTLTPSTGYRTF